jgi:hypothetical protein
MAAVFISGFIFTAVPSIKKSIVKEADAGNISIFILKNVLEIGQYISNFIRR